MIWLLCLKNFLKQEGYESETAENGNAGIEKLKSASFDLILVDFNLPDMEGDKVFATIKANGGSYGKAVLMSGQFESKVIFSFINQLLNPNLKNLQQIFNYF